MMAGNKILTYSFFDGFFKVSQYSSNKGPSGFQIDDWLFYVD